MKVFVNLCDGGQRSPEQTQALARIEGKFRALLEAAPDAMVISGEDGIIQLANSRTDLLFGYPREHLIGLSIASLIPEWTPPHYQGADSSNAVQVETRLTAMKHNGLAFPVEITRSPFESEEGLLITTAIRDATEQVRAEERIRRVNSELERRVEERTIDLTRSNEALRQFAWAASHDLQEPTRMVLTYSQWLAKTAAPKLDVQELDMLKCVQENGVRMQTLLAALRQYIYISESGGESWRPIDFGAAVKTATVNLQDMIDDCNASVICESMPTIQSIEILIVQLFQNLIANAIKYRSHEPPRVRVSAQAREGGWQFSVADNGIGIEPDYLQYVFGVFKRLHGRQYSGTGIGLAICKAAVDRLGGKIWAESIPGQGSTFHFFVFDRCLS